MKKSVILSRIFSENSLEEIQKIAQQNRCSIFEAAAEFCNENDIDPEYFVKCLDKTSLEIITMDILDQNLLRKKDAPKKKPQLLFG